VQWSDNIGRKEKRGRGLEKGGGVTGRNGKKREDGKRMRYGENVGRKRWWFEGMDGGEDGR